MKYKVRALSTYKELDAVDNNLGIIPNAGYEFIVDKERLDVLLGNNEHKVAFVEKIEEIKEEVSEEVVQAVANAIVEEAEEQNRTVENIEEEIVEESKPKRKRTTKNKEH